MRTPSRTSAPAAGPDRPFSLVLPPPQVDLALLDNDLAGFEPGFCTAPGVSAQLLRAADAMGFSRDEPLLRAHPSGAGEGCPMPPLASEAPASSAEEGIDNCCWLVDDSILDRVWSRCSHLLPTRVDDSGGLAGINARWRLFRYAPGAVYRPHVDGAWPGSGLQDGRLVFDAFGDRWSKFTALFYLNDGFEGGATTFFVPDAAGGLSAVAVAPQAGALVVFAHGDSPLSHVHEGSAVTRGVKYVIRTDILYMLEPESEPAPNQFTLPS